MVKKSLSYFVDAPKWAIPKHPAVLLYQKSKADLLVTNGDLLCYWYFIKFNLFCEDMGISTSSLQKTLKTGKPISRGKTMGWVAYDNIHNLDDYHNIQIY